MNRWPAPLAIFVLAAAGCVAPDPFRDSPITSEAALAAVADDRQDPLNVTLGVCDVVRIDDRTLAFDCILAGRRGRTDGGELRWPAFWACAGFKRFFSVASNGVVLRGRSIPPYQFESDEDGFLSGPTWSTRDHVYARFTSTFRLEEGGAVAQGAPITLIPVSTDAVPLSGGFRVRCVDARSQLSPAQAR